jgi:hypothetical protein
MAKMLSGIFINVPKTEKVQLQKEWFAYDGLSQEVVQKAFQTCFSEKWCQMTKHHQNKHNP